MRLIQSNDKPQTISAVGNGSYLYRFNIKEIEVPTQTEGEEPTKAWQYNEVVVWSPISSDAITKAVMNYIWSKDTEQKYINDYNAATLGILDATYIESYKNFMIQRKSIKEQIDKDYEEYVNYP